MSNINRLCIIELEDDALLVANSGQPFTRLGVVSICASHLGTKHEYQSTDPDIGGADYDLISAIQDREIQTYRTNPDRITSDFRGEEETGLDSGGRAIWELLQNADDAMAPPGVPPSRLIGVKGIGFKSILEISNEPEIHSGSFHFQFSSSKNISLLKKLELCNNPPSLTFRIPFKKPPNEKVNKLLKKYATVIRLPFRDGKRKQVLSWLNELDPRILLFCQYIEELEIVLGQDSQKTWKIFRENAGELTDCEMMLEVTTNADSEPKPIRFHRWAKTWEFGGQNKRHSVSICLPSNEKGDPVSDQFRSPLHVFFPTKEKLPFNSLIHASFDLEQNRKHVREGVHDERLLTELALLLRRIINEKVPAATILKAFIPQPDNIFEEQSLSVRIWGKFKEVIQKEDFIPVIGGHHVSPLNCNKWKFNIGNVIDHSVKYVQDSNLIIPEIQEDAHCQESLSVLEAKELDPIEYQNLLPYCLNNTKDECKETLNSLFQIVQHCTPPDYYGDNKRKRFLDRCREVNCWWNQNSHPRSLKNLPPFFRKPPEQSIPEWLPLDYLNDEFLKITESMADEGNASWKDLLNGFLRDSTDDEFLNYCLIPAIEEKNDKSWWEEYGKDVLNLYKKWVPQTKEIGPVWNDFKRVRLGKTLRLPTDKGWLPAIICYAGNEWGGPSIFDEFFSDVPDRGIILPLTRWPKPFNKDKVAIWQQKLRYAGVSWELKLMHWEVEKDRGWSIQGNIGKWMAKCPLESGVKNEHWIEYWNQLDPPEYGRGETKTFHWDAKVHRQWAIDYFPDALPPETEKRLRILRPIAKPVLDSSMGYTHEKTGYWGRTFEKRLPSFAHWQLIKLPWLPCKASLFHADKIIATEKAYMSGKGLNGLLPEVDIKFPQGQEGRDLVSFLTQDLMVQEELPPPDSIAWKEWLEALPEASSRAPNKENLERIVRAFYRALFALPKQPKDFPKDIRVPSIHWVRDNESCDEREQLSFVSSKDVYWLDKHYFAEPATRSELIRKFRIFLLELDHGKKAEEWLSLKRLSEIVEISPEYDSLDASMEQRVISQYKDRYTALQVIDEQIKLPNPSSLKLKVVKNLKLYISTVESKIASPSVTSWEDRNVILVDSGNPWRGLSCALTPHGRRGLSDTFENILKAKGWEEVLERLREHGISEATLEDLKESVMVLEGDQVTERIDKRSTQNVIETDEKLTEEESKIISKEGHAGEGLTEIIKGGGALGSMEHGQSPLSGNKIIPQGQSSVVELVNIITQVPREKGKEAEEWMKKRLKERLGEMWYVSGRERDAKGRESDIVLRNKQFGEFHIEVKHMEVNSIYWSEKEVEKAQEHHGRYFMVICHPVLKNHASTTYQEYWLLDPLIELSDFERYGYWLWQGKEQIKKLPEGWDIPQDKPFKEATNFHFHIKTPEQKLKDIAVGSFEDVKQIMENKH